MKLTTGILMMAMMAGGAWAQSPSATDNSSKAAKPAPGSPAPAVKPAIILASKSNAAPATPAKPAAKPAPVAASSADNKLEKVNVTSNGGDVRIEMSAQRAVNAKATKLSSPARVVVELPATAIATAQTKISVGNGGVKGVRIGMDGKTPPTTSVVVDLDQALAYELTPGPSDKFVLTLHTSGVAKNTAAPAPAAKPQTASAKPVVVPSAAAPKATTVAVAKTVAPTAKPAAPAPKQQAKTMPETKPTATTKAATQTTKPAAPVAVAMKPADAPKPLEASKQPKQEEKKWAMNGKRDPFFSPVVQQQGGSGCSSGKKCLEIGAINLRGVVKSDAGFIAVVTNSLNKAYFLRENDPVFNGYVVKITGDSVVFQETVQDKLGKPFTREVVKRIFTPAV